MLTNSYGRGGRCRASGSQQLTNSATAIDHRFGDSHRSPIRRQPSLTNSATATCKITQEKGRRGAIWFDDTSSGRQPTATAHRRQGPPSLTNPATGIAHKVSDSHLQDHTREREKGSHLVLTTSVRVDSQRPPLTDVKDRHRRPIQRQASLPIQRQPPARSHKRKGEGEPFGLTTSVRADGQRLLLTDFKDRHR
jgi:hypothetical protein